MKKTKARKIIKEAKACWFEKVEYELFFNCPNCGHELWDLDFYDEIDYSEI
jgi:transcription elongation factor Elf1